MPSRTPKASKGPFKGRRIFLRAPMPSDYREFAALMKVSARFYRRLINPFRGRTQFKEYLQRSPDGEFFRFMVCRNGDDVIVGMTSLFHITRKAMQSGCVGYMIGAPHARQGYATEALRLMLRFAFRKLKLHRVEANIQPTNVASIALVKRVGFQLEGYSPRYLKIHGQWRDHERWAILVERWRCLSTK